MTKDTYQLPSDQPSVQPAPAETDGQFANTIDREYPDGHPLSRKALEAVGQNILNNMDRQEWHEDGNMNRKMLEDMSRKIVMTRKQTSDNPNADITAGV